MTITSRSDPRVVLEKCDLEKKVRFPKKGDILSEIKSSCNYDVRGPKVKTRNKTPFESRVSISRSSHIISRGNKMSKSASLRGTSSWRRMFATSTDVSGFSLGSGKACCVLLTDILKTKGNIKKQSKPNSVGFSPDSSKACDVSLTDVLKVGGMKKQYKVTFDKNETNAIKKDVKILLERYDAKSSNEHIKPIANNVGSFNNFTKLGRELVRRSKEQGRITCEDELYLMGKSLKIVLKKCDEVVHGLLDENLAEKALVKRKDLHVALTPANSFNMLSEFNIEAQYKISCSESLLNLSPRVVLVKCDTEEWNENMRPVEDSNSLNPGNCLFYPETVVETEFGIEYEKDEVPSVSRNHSTQVTESGAMLPISSNSYFKNRQLSSSSITGYPPEEDNYSSFEFSEASHLQSDLRAYTGLKRFLCGLCSTSFSRKRDIKRHKITAHSEGNPFACQYCFAKFKSIKILQMHLRTHNGENPSSDKFTKNFELQSRQFSHIEERPFSGEHYPTTFKQDSDWRGSISASSAERSFSCEQCPARFTRKRHLKFHLLTHSTGRPFACEYCPARFKNGYTLKCHQVCHSAERPFLCKHCPASFKRKSSLKNHQIFHTGAVFSCYLCSSQFRKQEELQKHLMRHSKLIQEVQLFSTEQLLLLHNIF